MKKLLKVVAVVAFALSSVVVGAPAMAQQATCDIGFTGPDSNNMCTSTTKYECSVTNTNNVTIKNQNNQVVASGTVTNSGNTGGGGSVSGSVSNTNGTTFSVTISNESTEGQQGQTCTATVVVPAKTPETPPAAVTPVTPSGGEGQVRALPVTSSDTTLETVGWISGAMVLLAAASLGAAVLYRNRKLS